MTSLTNQDVNFIFSLYNLYAKKAAFELEEFGMVHVVYSKIKSFLIELKTHEGKESVN